MPIQSNASDPPLSVFGVTQAHAKKAVRWLAARSLASFYDPKEKSLRAFETKHGREWTYNFMHKALEATR